jgi:hypothetical protein
VAHLCIAPFPRGCPSLRFLQEPALSLQKGWAAMLPEQLLSVLHYPLWMPSPYPPLRLCSGQALRKVREGRAPAHSRKRRAIRTGYRVS